MTKLSHEFTVKDVADKFNINPTVVYYWLQTGKLQGSKKGPGRPWRITIDTATENDLRSYVETSTKISKAKCKRSLD